MLQGSTAHNLVELVLVCLLCSLLFLCNCARGFYCSVYALNFLGNVVRVYPRIVQGLTFLSA